MVSLGQDLGFNQGKEVPTTTAARPPVLEEALEGSADPVALGGREQVLQLLAESPPLHADAGRQDVRHPLQRGERRRRVRGVQGIGVCRAAGRRGTGDPAPLPLPPAPPLHTHTPAGVSVSRSCQGTA